MPTFRAMSFNVHHGANAAETLDLERIAQAIESSGALAVGLQEVDRNFSKRSGGIDQAGWLAQRLNMHVAFGANWDRDPEEGSSLRRQYGTAILSTYPILHSHNHQLTGLSSKSEPRGLLAAVLDVGGTDVNFCTTHLDVISTGTRSRQTRDILAITADLSGPLVLTGDFNAGPHSTAIRQLRESLHDVFSGVSSTQRLTFPAQFPCRRIDYIFTSPEISAHDARVIRTTASDHLPIVADLDLSDDR